MDIQYTLKYDEDKETFLFKKISVEISESATLQELFQKIHEVENIPQYREVKWEGNVEKLACLYHVLTEPNSFAFQYLHGNDFQKKISELPKAGPNGELSVYIDTEVGFVN